MAKIIVFIDALEPREMTGGFIDTQRGLIDSGVPKVTPKVMGEVYSGLSPSEQGMGANHAHGERVFHRPQAPLIQEKLEAAGNNVLSLFMPYCLPLQTQNGAWISTSMQQQQAGQHPLMQMCIQPPAGGNMLDPQEDDEEIAQSKTEDLYAKVASMLNTMSAGQFDVAFLGIRSVDEYTHFQWNRPHRKQIMEEIASEIGRVASSHDVLWFSDHGNEEKKEAFYVNRWLIENGYLDVEIDVEYAEKFSEDMKAMNPRAQGMDIENALMIGQPGVEMLPSSQAICGDPYDSSITILDDDLNPEQLGEELMETGYYKRWHTPEEIWGEGQYLDDCPDLLPARDDHVVVDSNLHPEPIGMGFYRTGVHSYYGAWGTTDESFDVQGDMTPQQFHDVIYQFVTGESQVEQEVTAQLEAIEKSIERAQNPPLDLQNPRNRRV